MNKILLADADESIRETLGSLLASEHYEVITASSPRAAVARLSASAPDLVLLDLNMPDLNPVEFLALVRNFHPPVPVITMTAISGEYERAAALDVKAHMEKPLEIPLLLAAIKDFVETPKSLPPRSVSLRSKTIFLSPRAHI